MNKGYTAAMYKGFTRILGNQLRFHKVKPSREAIKTAINRAAGYTGGGIAFGLLVHHSCLRVGFNVHSI